MKLLSLDDVSFHYEKHKTEKSSENSFAIKNISLQINEGEFISIIGKNGSGKSTLVKLISKILIGYNGKILYKETEIHDIDRKLYARNVAYLPQSSFYSDEVKVMDFLLLGRYAHKKFTDFTFSAEDKKVVSECLEVTKTEDLKGKFLYELSGGERQKVLITLALVQLDITGDTGEKILIIDEPLTYLDVNYQFEIFNILEKLKAKNLTVLVVIHDLNIALRYSDKTILMSKGEMAEFAETKKVITEEMIKEYFLIDSKIHSFEKNYFINYNPA